MTKPTSKAEWAALSHKLGVKTIHIAERDTQVCGTNPKKPGEFVNTWSVDGFISEGCQPAELGWGSHEKALPHDGAHHTFGMATATFEDLLIWSTFWIPLSCISRRYVPSSTRRGMDAA